MATLLVGHHTVSPPLAEILEPVFDGAQDDQPEGVDVVCRAGLSATASDVLAAVAHRL